MAAKKSTSTKSKVKKKSVKKAAKSSTSKKAASKSTAKKKAAKTTSKTKTKTAASTKKKTSAKTATKAKGANGKERIAMIEQTAYFIAEKRGFKGGDPKQDWLLAEKQVDELLKATSK